VPRSAPGLCDLGCFIVAARNLGGSIQKSRSQGCVGRRTLEPARRAINLCACWSRYPQALQQIEDPQTPRVYEHLKQGM
jgi:hypothetical protein